MQVSDVEHALEDPLIEPGLTKLVAVEDRPLSLPALGYVIDHGAVCLHGVDAVVAVEDPGRPVDAESTLTRAHADPDLAPDVVEVRRATTADRVLERSPGNQLALADHLVLEQLPLTSVESLTDAVILVLQ